MLINNRALSAKYTSHGSLSAPVCGFCCRGLVVVPTKLTPGLDKKNKESSDDQKLRHTPIATLREYFVFFVKILAGMYEISS